MTKRLCTICARGGSKGLPRKNIRKLLGTPLIAYSINQAKESGIFDYISVSSDSDEILSVAREYGVDFAIKRPDELASDISGKLPAITHAITETEKISGEQFDILVDLDATSPLRIVDDIRSCVKFFEENKESTTNIITGMQAHRSPYFNLVEIQKNGNVSLSKSLAENILRRQDSPKCYDMNASIYVWGRDFLDNPAVFYDNTRLFVMPDYRSQDIDSELDFRIVEMILKDKLNLAGKSYGI